MTSKGMYREDVKRRKRGMSDSAPPGVEAESDGWCRTSLGDEAKTQYTWVIEQFKRRPEKVGEVISSGTFSVSGPGSQDTQWCLQMYPEGRTEETMEHVALYLASKNKEPVRASFTLYVVTGRNQKECVFRECEEVCNFQPVVSDNGTRWGNTEFIHEDKFEDPHFLTGDGDLKVVVDLTVYGPEKTVTSSTTYDSSGVSQVGLDFWKLYEDKEMTDVVIICGGKTFICHKLVLSARSPTFKEMFKAGLEDSKFDISDLSCAAFEKILRFMYTGTLALADIPREMWDQLLRGADKLQLEHLKWICEEKLASTD